jgi:hypothetical protein
MKDIIIVVVVEISTLKYSSRVFRLKGDIQIHIYIYIYILFYPKSQPTASVEKALLVYVKRTSVSYGSYPLWTLQEL